MSVDGTGRPIAPLKSTPAQVIVATGEVSVRPQPCDRMQPVAAFQRAATAPCSAMPPATQARSVEKSIAANPGALSSAL